MEIVGQIKKRLTKNRKKRQTWLIAANLVREQAIKNLKNFFSWVLYEIA